MPSIENMSNLDKLVTTTSSQFDGKSVLTTTALDAIFTDYYQCKMAYAYWKCGKHTDKAVFDVYFRKNPFGGEFTIFTGLTEVLHYVTHFRILPKHIDFIRKQLPDHVEEEFFSYLLNIDIKEIRLTACKEGAVVFPNIPLIILEGPILVIQLLETAILNFVNYSSLITTNAVHFRQIVGDKCILSEFGSRRAQGPNGAMTASVKSYIGGFDSTSNMLCGLHFGVPLSGTVAHSFISSFTDDFPDIRDIYLLKMRDSDKIINLLELSKKYLNIIQDEIFHTQTRTVEAELKAFAAFACAYPSNFLVVVDTYNVLNSGIPNFCATSLALNECGYKATGIRVDSGDIAYFSRYSRKIFRSIAQKYKIDYFGDLCITASNDISTSVLISLKQQGHEIDVFGIGNQLVTCQQQTTLGLVYKLVQINNQPTIKLTADSEKVTIPYKKRAYRLYNNKDLATLDLLMLDTENPPIVNEKILCRHPLKDLVRVNALPSRVEELHHVFLENGQILQPLPSIHQLKQIVKENLQKVRKEHLKFIMPNPYKVSLSSKLFENFHELLRSVTPIGELY